MASCSPAILTEIRGQHCSNLHEEILGIYVTFCKAISSEQCSSHITISRVTIRYRIRNFSRCQCHYHSFLDWLTKSSCSWTGSYDNPRSATPYDYLHHTKRRHICRSAGAFLTVQGGIVNVVRVVRDTEALVLGL